MEEILFIFLFFYFLFIYLFIFFFFFFFFFLFIYLFFFFKINKSVNFLLEWISIFMNFIDVYTPANYLQT